MFVHHAYHCDRTTNQNCDDPYEKYPKTENSVDHFHACLRSFVLADDRKPTTNDGTGGADRDRTGGLLVANQALSQLSYSPDLVGLGRLELPTSRLSGVRSSHLSYRPGGSKISRPFRSPKSLFPLCRPEQSEGSAVQTNHYRFLAPLGMRAESFFEDKVERAIGLSPI